MTMIRLMWEVVVTGRCHCIVDTFPTCLSLCVALCLLSKPLDGGGLMNQQYIEYCCC